MQIPENLQYTETHEWVAVEGDVATVGLTDFAQSEMGDIVYIELPEVGDEVEAGESFTDIESVKAVAEVNSPVSGEVTEANEELLDAPERINEAPYDAWIIRVELGELGEDLMDAAAYAEFCESEKEH